MDALIALCAGVGLAAACGFRVFVPLLALGLAAHGEWVTLSPGFAWLSGTPALVVLSTATVIEILGYYVPWLDHLLDTIATPAAVLAGILASASVFTDAPPILRWSIAIVAGGGAAGTIQGATALLRLKSTALTGGAANPVFATLELIGAVLASALAIVFPVAAVLIAVGICAGVFALFKRLAFGRRAAA